MALREAVAQRLRDTRRRRGITQQTLAELIGRSERWMSDVELGRVDVGLSELERLAERLRVDVAYFVLGDGLAAEPTEVAPRTLSPQFGRIRSRETLWGTRVGRLLFPWVVAGYGPYRSENIESYFHPAEPAYPSEIDDALKILHEDAAALAARGEWKMEDFEAYKLIRFHTPARTRRHDEPRLVLHFAPSTFYRVLVTDQWLDQQMVLEGRTTTLRQRYAADVDLRVRPVPEFATHWGIALAVVTADGFLLVSERSNVAGITHVLVPPVTSSVVRTLDLGADGAPDHVSAAMRAMQDHLGVDLLRSELTWLSFGASSVLCSYALIGRVDTRHSLADIEQRRSMGLARESWKTRRLQAIEFTPRAVAEYCSQSDLRFSALALVAMLHALMSEFGAAKVEEAFGRVSVSLAQNLPQWLDAMSGGA